MFLTVSPVLGEESGGLVPCGNPGQEACTSEDLTGMIGNVFDFVAFQIVPTLAIIGFVVATSKSTKKILARLKFKLHCFQKR